MIKDLLIESSRLSIIPTHIDLLYHFIDYDKTMRILNSDTLKPGSINYGLEVVQKKIPSIQDTKGAVSLTRNRHLFWKNLPFAIMFERKELQRFYKLYPVQPRDEWTGNKLSPSPKTVKHYEWDEEIIVKPITNLKNISFGFLIREHLSPRTSVLKELIEMFEQNTINDYTFYIQNPQGFITQKITTREEFHVYIEKQI